MKANIFLEKNPNSKIGKLIERINGYIKGSIFQGHVFVVGGAVRDYVMGLEKQSSDCDIVVDLPDGGAKFAAWLAYQNGCNISNKNPVFFPTYGTAKLQLLNDADLSDIEIECVQTRKEKYIKGSRNPTTFFGTIYNDAMRRDLTINALYYNISTNSIWDITNRGISDINNQIIRTTGKANDIYADDPLRMLRCIRFATRFHWGIEKDTWLGIISNVKNVNSLTQERITQEINKMLIGEHPGDAIDKMLKCGLLHEILPEIVQLTHIYQNIRPIKTVYEHTIDTLNNSIPKLEVRLAALLHDIGKIDTFDKNFLFHQIFSVNRTEEIMKRMKYSNSITDTVKLAVGNHESFSQYSGCTIPRPQVIRKFVDKFNGNNNAVNVCLDLIHANNISQMFGKKIKQVSGIRQKLEELDKKGESAKKIELPITGIDIMKHLSIKPSATVGALINKVKQAWIENPKLTKEEALKIVKDEFQKMSNH